MEKNEAVKQKNEIRKEMKQKKALLTEQEIFSNSRKICDKVLASKEYKEADQVFAYVNFNQEVVTISIIKDALKQQKKVAVPKICGDTMQFYYIHSLDELESGYFGILEPESEELADANGCFMLLPGLAFDETGSRIGYGKGFYDRYLNQFTPKICVALAYDFQLLPKIPSEAMDKKADAVFTEKRERYFK